METKRNRLSEGSTFKNCIDCRVDKDGSFIKFNLVFGSDCYDESALIANILFSSRVLLYPPYFEKSTQIIIFTKSPHLC